MLTRRTRAAGVLIASALAVAACGKGNEIHVDKLLLHESAEQVLVVANATGQTLTLIGAGPETPDRELGPGAEASIRFRVISFDDLDLADNEEWFERANNATNLARGDAGAVYIVTDGPAATFTLRTSDDEWEFRYVMNSCDAAGWEGAPASSGSRRIVVADPPDASVPLPLCPANSP